MWLTFSQSPYQNSSNLATNCEPSHSPDLAPGDLYLLPKYGHVASRKAVHIRRAKFHRRNGESNFKRTNELCVLDGLNELEYRWIKCTGAGRRL